MPRTAEQFKEIRTDRKKAILDAALHVFSEQGYHNTSIIEVSKKAGISKGLIYNYFDSKEELLDILLGSFLDDEMSAVKKVLKKPLTGFTMIEFIKLNTQILKAKLKQWKLYFSLVTQPEVIKILQDRFSEENIFITQKIMEFFKQKGDKNSEMTFTLFSTTIVGLKMSYIMDSENYPIEKIEELIIKQFITS